MKHYGDITKLHGAELPIVDIITGGSPCQDLSVAGKREGLAGERSGLFMEQIRLIKEMREHDRNTRPDVDFRLLRPRYMVWENVPGAFSSNKGEDFRAVLEETARIVDKNATIPKPEGGRWTPSGCIMGSGWSIAWRVHDAQFWGVPQRRKRIALVADFGGESAPEILFERKGMSGDIEESGEERKETSKPVGEDSEETISFQERAGCSGGVRESLSNTNEQEHCQHSTTNQYCLNDQGGQQIDVSENVSGTLRAEEHGHQPAVVYGISAYESNAMKSPNPKSGVYEADTTRTLDNNGGNPACNQGGMIVLEGNGSRDSHRGDGYKESEISYSLNTVEHHAVCVGNGQMDNITMKPIANGLDCMHDQQAVITYGVDCYNQTESKEVSKSLNSAATDSDHIPCVYGIDRASFNQGQNAQFDFSVEEEKAQTIVAKGPGGVLTKG